MLRSIGRDVLLQRSIARISRSPTLTPNLIRYRSLSTQVPLPPPQEKDTDSISIAAAAQRKAKLDLRPAPIKPKSSTTTSAHHTPSKPTVPLPKSTPSSTVTSVKEATKHDIEDAEAHGILTPPPPDANWFKRTLHKGVQLAKFYYRGVKLIFIRRKDIAFIQARIKAGGAPLSRWESRLIRTQKDDVNKVVPFIFIALLLEEVIPLIAIYAPFMLPSTCILPSQSARIQEKKTEKAISYASLHRILFRNLSAMEDPKGHLSIGALRTQPGAPDAVCGILRLSTIGIDALRIRRVRRHLEYIQTDDALLSKDSVVSELSETDITDALEERGIITQGMSLKSKEATLRSWLDSVKDSDDAIARRLFLLVNRP